MSRYGNGRGERTNAANAKLAVRWSWSKSCPLIILRRASCALSSTLCWRRGWLGLSLKRLCAACGRLRAILELLCRIRLVVKHR